MVDIIGQAMGKQRVESRAMDTLYKYSSLSVLCFWMFTLSAVDIRSPFSDVAEFNYFK